ncbi:hypothetical protein THAOC_31880 [Thalassiosira oceanica]|uniref:CBS domain-containing protein n=1 Tax=Thalassiosira oceanica TaxID=159749 RepID=K0RK67_THAOC|nr:hypothetical protein THAOC_31880 [Thalassiosira oceanica]|eukprot:EJK49266.1 hypothetical protein THAOC_31880 [Thalassiosira oceanica]
MLASYTRMLGGRLRMPSPSVAARGVQTLGDAKAATAGCAWKKSCYSGIDYTINEDSPVIEAVEKLAAYNVGALVTTDVQGKCHCHCVISVRRAFRLHLLGTGNLSGVLSERDYVTKIALLERSSKEVKVKEISTKAANLVTASPEETTDLDRRYSLRADSNVLLVAMSLRPCSGSRPRLAYDVYCIENTQRMYAENAGERYQALALGRWQKGGRDHIHKRFNQERPRGKGPLHSKPSFICNWRRWALCRMSGR